MRYSVYQLRKHPARAHLHVVVPGGALPERIVFDGQPKSVNWTPLPVEFIGNDVPPAEISTIFGPSALVLSRRALELLRQAFDVASCEFLPLDCPGQEFFICNVMTQPDCLRADKSRLDAKPKSYQFIPARFGPSVFKIPQDPAGPVLILHDDRSHETSLPALAELHDIVGVRFELVWEGNEKRQLELKKPAPKVDRPPLPVPTGVRLVASRPQVILQWPAVAGFDSFIIQWSRFPDAGFVTVDTIQSGQDPVSFTDPTPALGSSYYRIFTYSGDTKYRSQPSEVVSGK